MANTTHEPIDAEFDDGINEYRVAERSTEATVGNNESLEAVKYRQVDPDGCRFLVHRHNGHA